MAQDDTAWMRWLDQCIPDRKALNQIRAALDKIEKCCIATDRGISLADVMNDPANKQSMAKAFGGSGNLPLAMQVTFKIALQNHAIQNWTLKKAIADPKRIEFLRRTLAGWKQFDMTMVFQVFEKGKKVPSQICVIKPSSVSDWQGLGELPASTLVTAYVKTAGPKRSASEEELALERIGAILDIVQNRADLRDEMSAPRGAPAAAPKPAAAKPSARPPAPPKTKPRVTMPRPVGSPFGKSKMGNVGGELSFSLPVVINKMDTFVHAGNAHIIVNHCSDYPGRIQMCVMRGEKQKVNMDADSIWSAEIRNGETVVYEFYGPKPDDAFVKELAKRTNKYTQMDKVGGE